MPSTSRSPSPRRDCYDRRSPRPSDRSREQPYTRQEPPYPSSSSSKDRRRDEDRYRGARDSRTDSRRDERSSHSHRRDRHDDDGHQSSRHREERDRDRSRRHRDDRDRSRRHDDDRERTRRHRDEREYSRSSKPAEEDEERRSRHRKREEEEREYRSQRDRDPPRSSRQQDEPFAPPAEDLPIEEDQDQPDFAPSGLLARESNQKNGTALKYREPPEAKKPKLKWRLYVFKAGEQVDLFHVSRQSCYLFGRDKNVVDVQLDHESCSKQHAVLQFRSLAQRDEFGDEKRSTKPYVWDLESSNGTMVNSRDIPPLTYHELKNGDTMKFGGSESQWVLLCEEA